MDDIRYAGDDVVNSSQTDADPTGRQSIAIIAVVGIVAVAIAAAMLFIAVI